MERLDKLIKPIKYINYANYMENAILIPYKKRYKPKWHK